MISNETKEQFIILRAENKSYSFIQKKLDISKDTCIKWNKEFNSHIAELKAENLTRLYNTYAMTKELRIKSMGDTLKKINKALDNVDYSQIAPEKLLDYKIKYTQALKEEFTETAYRIDTPTTESIAEALKDLLERVRAGNNDTQTTKELNIIALMLKNHTELAPSQIESDFMTLINRGWRLTPSKETQEYLDHNRELSILAGITDNPDLPTED